MKRKLLPFFAALAVSEGAFACQCEPHATLEELEQTYAQQHLEARIFVGRVDSIEPKNADWVIGLKAALGRLREIFGGEPYFPSDDRKSLVIFQLLEIFRGPREGVVETMRPPSMCGYFFEVGREYLVFAHRGQHKQVWETSICSRTQLLTEAGSDIQLLRSRAVQ